MNLYSLSILSVSRDTIFKDDFSFYSDLVFADDLWISTGIVCLTIPCIKHDFIFVIGFMRRSWIRWRCRLHMSAVTHTSLAISRSLVTLFSLTISGRLWRSFHWRFHASTMTLFSLLISFVNRELVCAADSIRQPWLNFQRWLLVLLWLIVCLTIPCIKHESIFAIGFMCRSWIRGRCRLHKSAVTHISVVISRSTVTLFSLTISGR
jgi:hypothetical protein